jgi:hypothetical protein
MALGEWPGAGDSLGRCHQRERVALRAFAAVVDEVLAHGSHGRPLGTVDYGLHVYGSKEAQRGCCCCCSRRCRRRRRRRRSRR